MEMSIFLAKVLGAFYVVIGVGLFFNSKHYHKAYTDMMKSSGIWLFAGIFALIIGILLVLAHNVWEWQWYVIITVIGWIALVKGILLLIFPKQMVAMGKSMFKSKNLLLVAGIVAVVLGVILGYFGYADCCEWLTSSLS
jgi:uncharacterized protein YjeT (DUF2065 family)